MKEADDAYQFDCPVCGQTIVDFRDADYEYLRTLCPHVVLVHSMNEFVNVDESMEVVVDEMERMMEEDDGMTMTELMAEYADHSDGEYHLFCLDDPNSIPLLDVTIALLVQMTDDHETQQSKNTGRKDMTIH